MKVAIVLLLAFVAVSQAAFTANLVQRAQPILAKSFQPRIRTDDGMLTTIGQTLSEHAAAILQQIQDSINNGVEVAQGMYDSLAAALSDISDLGSNAVDAVTSIIGNFFGNLFGGSKRAFDLSTITDVLSGLGLDNLLGHLFQYVVSLIASLEVPEFIQSALSAILSSDIVQSIMSSLFGRQRGLFGDLLNGLSGAASNIASQIAGFVASIQDQIAAGLATAQQLAIQALAEAQAAVGELTQAAADQIIATITPLAHDMGALYEQVVTAINNLVGKKPY